MIRFELMSKNWLFILEYKSDTYRNTDTLISMRSGGENTMHDTVFHKFSHVFHIVKM